MTEELRQKAEEYAEKQCENCSYRCDRPNMFKRLSNKKECYAYSKSYEAYIAGALEATKELSIKIDRLESACDAYNYSQQTYQEEIKELKAQIGDLKDYVLKVSKFLHNDGNVRPEYSVYKERDMLLAKELKLFEKWGQN